MTTIRKQVIDNLEEVADNILQYIISEEMREALINTMAEAREKYSAPKHRWIVGPIYSQYRTRDPEIFIAEEHIAIATDENDILQDLITYFSHGKWFDSSANSTLMRLLIAQIELKSPYEHKDLTLDELQRLSKIFIDKANQRIKDNRLMRRQKLIQEAELEQVRQHKHAGLSPKTVASDIEKSYVAPDRRNIFVTNPGLITVARKLNNILATADVSDVHKSYMAPDINKIKYSINPLYPEVNLSDMPAKLANLFVPPAIEMSVISSYDPASQTLGGNEIYIVENYDPTDPTINHASADSLADITSSSDCSSTTSDADEQVETGEEVNEEVEFNEEIFSKESQDEAETNSSTIEADVVEENVLVEADEVLTDTYDDSPNPYEYFEGDEQQGLLHESEKEQASDDSEYDDMPEIETVSEEMLSKARFAEAKAKLNEFFSQTIGAKQEDIHYANQDDVTNDDDYSDEEEIQEEAEQIASPSVAPVVVQPSAPQKAVLQGAESGKTKEERFAVAAKNISTLFGATLHRREIAAKEMAAAYQMQKKPDKRLG